jgi:hypothetical protein
MGYVIAAVVFGILFLLFMRWLGSWMLRIDDVIQELREIKEILRKEDSEEKA